MAEDAGPPFTDAPRRTYSTDPDKFALISQGDPLQIQCVFVPDGIEVRLLDEGDPFDITAVPHLDPSELRPGGRGVFLMRRLMDELSTQPRGNHGNTLRMVKLRRPANRSA